MSFERENIAAGRHGASSERQIKPVARNHRRRVLRQLRLSSREFDPVGRAYLDAFVRLQAKVDLIDRYVDEHGLIRAEGEPRPVMRRTSRSRTGQVGAPAAGRASGEPRDRRQGSSGGGTGRGDVTDALDLLSSLRLEDGRLCGCASEVQRAYAAAIIDPD